MSQFDVILVQSLLGCAPVRALWGPPRGPLAGQTRPRCRRVLQDDEPGDTGGVGDRVLAHVPCGPSALFHGAREQLSARHGEAAKLRTGRQKAGTALRPPVRRAGGWRQTRPRTHIAADGRRRPFPKRCQ